MNKTENDNKLINFDLEINQYKHNIFNVLPH